MSEPLYALLRVLFKTRVDSAALGPEDRPTHINFLNVVEQAMEVAFTDNAGLNILMFLFMVRSHRGEGEGRGGTSLCTHSGDGRGVYRHCGPQGVKVGLSKTLSLGTLYRVAVTDIVGLKVACASQ